MKQGIKNVFAYLFSKPLLLIGILLLLIFLGAGIFLAIANRELRHDIGDLKSQNKSLHKFTDSLRTANESLLKELADRNEKINQGTLIFDSLKTTLENLNKKNIVYVYEDYNVVAALDLDGQISLLAGFIADADSAR